MIATEAQMLTMTAKALDKEVSRLKEERDELRKALLDALTVFEITPATQFRKHYAGLIERAQRNLA